MSIMIPAWVDGKLIPVEKLETHKRGLRHKAVSVFVLRGEDVLIQRRALGKYHTPGLWANTCCTHPNWGEEPLDCAQRRLSEELGIRDLDLEHCHHLEYRADVGNDLIEHEVVDVFVGHAQSDIALQPDPHEVMETRWVPYPDLWTGVAENPDHYTPWLRIYLKDHASMIFGENLIPQQTA